MSCLKGSPSRDAVGCSPDAFLSSSLRGGQTFNPSELLLNWPESWYALPPASVTSEHCYKGGEGCSCTESECDAGECCVSLGVNLEGGGSNEDCSAGGEDLEKEDLSGGVIELEQSWELGSLAVHFHPLENENCAITQVRLGLRGEALQREASVAFCALVSTRASMHSKLRSRSISAVVSDWQMKWNWDLVLDKVSELNKRWTQHNEGGASGGGGARRVGVVAQWWQGVRRSEAGGKLTWRVLASGNWEVW